MVSLSSLPERGVECLTEHHVPRIAQSVWSNQARHIGIADTDLGIGETHRATGTRRAVRASAAEPAGVHDFMKAFRPQSRAPIDSMVWSRTKTPLPCGPILMAVALRDQAPLAHFLPPEKERITAADVDR